MTALIVTAALTALIVVAIVVRGARVEARKQRAFEAHLDRLTRRCPACQPWGGFILGRMRPDGGYETHTCDVCGGTGELPEREAIA